MNKVRNYFIGCKMEADGVVIDQNVWTDDESQAVNFYKEFLESIAPVSVVVIKRWNGTDYVKMAFEKTVV